MSRPLAKAALVLAVLGLAFHLAATAAIAKTRTLRGTVTYRERMALPPSAVVEVKLAPEPTATAPATMRVARGTRTLRRLAAMSCSWGGSGPARCGSA